MQTLTSTNKQLFKVSNTPSDATSKESNCFHIDTNVSLCSSKSPPQLFVFTLSLPTIPHNVTPSRQQRSNRNRSANKVFTHR